MKTALTCQKNLKTIHNSTPKQSLLIIYLQISESLIQKYQKMTFLENEVTFLQILTTRFIAEIFSAIKRVVKICKNHYTNMEKRPFFGEGA